MGGGWGEHTHALVAGAAVEVERQVTITVLHEIGHYLGLDEDELHQRGLG